MGIDSVESVVWVYGLYCGNEVVYTIVYKELIMRDLPASQKLTNEIVVSTPIAFEKAVVGNTTNFSINFN